MPDFGILHTISLSLGVAWASGVRLYATIFTLGVLGALEYMVLPSSMQVLQDPVVLTVSGVLMACEFVADKVPAFDTVWDAIHTAIRIPAGAVLSAAALGDVNPAVLFAAGLVGGTVTAATHATKSGSRALINTSPEPFSNWATSFSEDVAVLAGLWTALAHPWIFLSLLFLFLLLVAFLLPKIWKGVRYIFSRLKRLIVSDGGAHPPGTSTPAAS